MLLQRINNCINWYQQKIGAYDKQLWERSVEETVLKNISQVPKKSARVKSELIDVDLVRGSTFSKNKPQQGFVALIRAALMHMLFLPFYLTWWSKQTSKWLTIILLFLYALQITTTVVYIAQDVNQDDFSVVHLVCPWLLVTIMAILHTQIVATRLTQQQYEASNQERKRKNAIRTQKKQIRESVRSAMMDNISSLTTFSLPTTPEHLQSRSCQTYSDLLHNCASYADEKLDVTLMEGVRCNESSKTEFNNDSKDDAGLNDGLRRRHTILRSHSHSDLKDDVDSSALLQGHQKPIRPVDLMLPGGPQQIQFSEWEDDAMNLEGSSSGSSCGDESACGDSDFSDHELSITGQKSNWHSTHAGNVIMRNLATASDKVSCLIWEGAEVKKLDLSVLDLGWTIIQKVDRLPDTTDYLLIGLAFSILSSVIPICYRVYGLRTQFVSHQPDRFLKLVFLNDWRVILIIMNGIIQRFVFSLLFFFLLCVAEKTFKQRLQYAKHFCYLTSLRRAQKYELPHFRLNKVRNIKMWLSLRSYLKKRGPQRSVDCIVSASFLLAVIVTGMMSAELLKSNETFMTQLGHWELVVWGMALALFLLRYITLGTAINRKYRNFSVLITEQINLYLHMEQKPHKKDELMMANSVLKLASDLLKELESPFKISGLAANPFLYNMTKIVILSAFSGVLSEMLGFKLKLYKIKLRS